MSLCTFHTEDQQCKHTATHLTYAHWHTPFVWYMSSTPEQLETLNGFKLFRLREDRNGKPVLDADGVPIRDPVMQSLEFCAQHADVVCRRRNDIAQSALTQQRNHA
jgi:hypothetical protein